jgi:hypothetical protein
MTPPVYATLFVSMAVAIVVASWVIARHLTATKQARAELTTGEQYRRLSDMSITAQEHLDLKLTELSVRMDELRDQMEQMQRILKEVE